MANRHAMWNVLFVVLEAFRSEGAVDRVAWKIEVALSGQCSVGTRALEDAQCSRIRSLLTEVRNAGAPPAPTGSLKDEPRYRIGWVEGGKASALVPVALEAPKTCRVSPAGEIRCEENRLVPAQKLLIELRSLFGGRGNGD